MELLIPSMKNDNFFVNSSLASNSQLDFLKLNDSEYSMDPFQSGIQKTSQLERKSVSNSGVNESNSTNVMNNNSIANNDINVNPNPEVYRADYIRSAQVPQVMWEFDGYFEQPIDILDEQFDFDINNSVNNQSVTNSNHNSVDGGQRLVDSAPGMPEQVINRPGFSSIPGHPVVGHSSLTSQSLPTQLAHNNLNNHIVSPITGNAIPSTQTRSPEQSVGQFHQSHGHSEVSPSLHGNIPVPIPTPGNVPITNQNNTEREYYGYPDLTTMVNSNSNLVVPLVESQFIDRSKCSVCGKKIQRDMQRHMRTHHLESRFICPFPLSQCNHKSRKFNRPYDFKKHLLNKHFNFLDPSIKRYHNLSDKLNKWGFCNCGKKLLSNDWLTHHILIKDDNEKCELIKENR